MKATALHILLQMTSGTTFSQSDSAINYAESCQFNYGHFYILKQFHISNILIVMINIITNSQTEVRHNKNENIVQKKIKQRIAQRFFFFLRKFYLIPLRYYKNSTSINDFLFYHMFVSMFMLIKSNSVMIWFRDFISIEVKSKTVFFFFF